jgi:hypothetical protein
VIAIATCPQSSATQFGTAFVTTGVVKTLKKLPRERGKRGMSKPLVTIENWAVVQSVVFQSYELLQPGKHLMGNFVGHANLPDTLFIYTSSIVSVDRNMGVVETRNTRYQLGEASDEYKTWERERRAATAA